MDRLLGLKDGNSKKTDKELKNYRIGAW